jgi:hypothetical protein
MWWRLGGSCIEKPMVDRIPVADHTDHSIWDHLELMMYAGDSHGVEKRFFCDDKALRGDRQHHNHE